MVMWRWIAWRGGTIVSTEELFEWLLDQWPLEECVDERIDRLILAGEVDGIYTADPQVAPDATRITHLTSQMLTTLRADLGGSHGVDVTGGMVAKVAQAFRMIERRADLDILICSGLSAGVLLTALTTDDRNGLRAIGTHLHH